MAADIVGALDYDCRIFKLSTSTITSVAQRSKKLDQVTRDFIATHPDAAVVDLGVGLDTRAYRINPPSAVDWYDVDFSEVIALRQGVTPQRANVHALGTDVTSPNWIGAISADRPAVIIADGLMAFLSQAEMTALINGFIKHFPSGEIAFNGYTRFAIWAAKHYRGTQSIAGLVKADGFDDAHEPETWCPGLKLLNEVLLTREPEVADFPFGLRVANRLAALSTAWSRRGATVLHYGF